MSENSDQGTMTGARQTMSAWTKVIDSLKDVPPSYKSFFEDIGRGRKAHESQYGGIWQYIPLRSIQSAAWSEAWDDRLTLSLTLAHHQTIEKNFSVGAQAELRQCCVQLQEIIGRNQDFA